MAFLLFFLFKPILLKLVCALSTHSSFPPFFHHSYCLQNLLALDLEGRVFHCATPEQLAADPTLVSICLPTGDLYLQSQDIDPKNVWRNIGILAVMAPVYLFLAYLFLRALKKST